MATDEPIHITITILQNHIDMWVKPEHEVYYREAERRINDRAADLIKKWGYSDEQDLLSKLLIETTVNYIAQNSQLHNYQETVIPKMETILKLAVQLDDQVQTLDR
ncbi:MAG: cell division protein ZapA [Bacteroidales bacterium]|mgnify:CR=1 FL=1|nr:cell division protein ZapA [Bacteroidales bacterium]